jgi:hypothetical protein
MKNFKYFKFVFYLVIGLLVFYKALSFIDPDFGWHLTTGNLILKSAFPKTDPYSYTMPSFPLIEYEWLVDVTFAKIYPALGIPGISVLFSTLFLSAVLISVFKSKKFKTTLFVIGISSLTPFFSISPKIFSWLSLSIFAFAVFNRTFWEKYWLLTPLIIILWANLHGSFPEALVILLVILICKSYRDKRIWVKGALVTLLSFLATLVNPYGLKLWWVVWLTITNPLLKYRIAEWQPTYLNLFGFSFLAIFLFAISAIFISRYWRRFKAEEIVLNLIFFIQALFAVRMIPYWVLINLPMVAVAIEHFTEEFAGDKTGEKRFLVLSKCALLFVGIIFVSQSLGFAFQYSNSHKEDLFYPKKAVLYLKEKLPGGQIFSEYNWGGYLIWKLPEKKVFISGMMPVWRWQANIPGESNDAMGDYLDTINGKIPYQVTFGKYRIDTVLLSTSKEPGPTAKFVQKLASSLGIVRSANIKNPLYDELKKDGWRQVYQDASSVILKEPSK